ncbi:MAG TPA: hypothetical protein VFT68_07855 [Lapillicoccus sp.]|nr:hypothetical protein [Lapillicoccus sp.]
MSATPLHPDRTPHAAWTHVLAVSVGLTALLCLLVVAFAWPATQLAPRSLPIVVAGPTEATAQVTAALGQAVPGGFAVTSVADEAAARAAIERREAYGAVVLGATPTVLTASAASPAVAQLMSQLATTLESRQPGATPPTIRVVDVVATPPADPRGVGLAALALPLVLGGLVVGAAMSTAVTGVGRRVVGVILTAAFAGMALTAIAHTWLGVLDGSWWAEAGVIALGIAAVGLTLVGLEALFGFAGLGIGAAVVMLIGNPFSGMTSAPEMLPTGWATLGQWLPPGATGTLLRSVAFFDGAGGMTALWILLGWVAFGLVLAGLGARRMARHEAVAVAPVRPIAA